MTKIDESISQIMTAQKIHCFAVKAQNQCPEFINPSESTLTGEALFVDVGVEKTLASPFHSLTIACVLGDIRDDFVIEAYFAGGFGIKSTVRIEKRSRNRQPQTFHTLESLLQLWRE